MEYGHDGSYCLLESLVALFREHMIRFCSIGDQAIDAYVEPLMIPDLNLVVAAHQPDQIEELPVPDIRRFRGIRVEVVKKAKRRHRRLIGFWGNVPCGEII